MERPRICRTKPIHACITGFVLWNRARTMQSNQVAGFSSSFFPRLLAPGLKHRGFLLVRAYSVATRMSHAKSTHRVTLASLDRAALQAAVAKLARTLKEMRDFDVGTVETRTDERPGALQRRVNNVLSDLVGMGSPDYKQHALGPIDADLD